MKPPRAVRDKRERNWIRTCFIFGGGVLLLFFAIDASHLSTRLDHLEKPRTTTTLDRTRPIEDELRKIREQLDEMQNDRGLSPAEVRALVETLLPPTTTTTTPTPTTMKRVP